MHSWSDLFWFEWLIMAVYTLFLGFIFIYSLSQLHLLLRYRSNAFDNIVEPQIEWPFVTIQLPVFNEKYVLNRLVDAIIGLDYPKDRIQIQILDDSTDETLEMSQEAAFKWREKGFDIVCTHRQDRGGYKAGALSYGLQSAKGEFIAIFDADFLPSSDFLKKTIPHFTNDAIGLVQTRWGHLNRRFNMLTQLQAMGLDAHFTVEQGGRSASKSFINFNGTAGVWRKQAIIDAGGWSDDTLTEDLDISYRAQLKGWEFIYLEEVVAPAELPVTMNALRTQQHRWTKGAAECAVKNLGQLLKNDGFSFQTKLHGFFHLMNSFIFISVFITAILSVPMLLIKEKIGQDSIIVSFGMLFTSSVLILMIFYWTSFKKVDPAGGFFIFLWRFFTFLSMSMGMSLHNSIAVAEAYAGRKTPFIRTPKFNLDSKNSDWRGNEYLKNGSFWLSLVEALLTFFFAGAVLYGLQSGDYGLLPFHIMLSFGFGMVSFYGFRHSS